MARGYALPVIPSGAKAQLNNGPLVAGLKSRPFKTVPPFQNSPALSKLIDVHLSDALH